MKKLMLTAAILSFSVFAPLFAGPDKVDTEIFETKEGRQIFFKALREDKGPVVLGTYKLNPAFNPDQTLLDDLKIRTKENRDTTVLIDGRLSDVEKRGVEGSIEKAHKMLSETGAKLAYPEQFAYSHLKILYGDNVAFVGTTNFDHGITSESDKRDFTVMTTNPQILSELKDVIGNVIDKKEIDWKKYDYKVADLKTGETRLSWGPFHHLQHLTDMIDGAKKSIAVYQQDIQDATILKHLLQALDRKVNVRVLMSEHPFDSKFPNKSLPNLKSIIKQVGQVHLTNQTHIHAKVMIVDYGTDQEMMYVGSANFYLKTLNPEQNNLNVGIITRQKDMIKKVDDYFNDDWNNKSTALKE